MPSILQHSTQDIQPGNGSLPLQLTQNVETLLTSIWLTALNPANQLVFWGNAGWSVQLLNLSVTPQLTFRIRQNGFSPSDPVIFQTTDSLLFPGNMGFITLTSFHTSFTHTKTPDPAKINIAVPYYLTVSYFGLGNVAISGPVNLTGQVLG
ncbi:hypothetical protein [Paenibacillus sp. JDR-2]|uniref:hypothetical protein n=1 Tax=Paenibacillus sp. (strain JDR-2) TaxID=324057 RepID=UPI0001666982|nr:hypothetical protein [Paenibacillus sp. JDR-2]ACT01709.1 hypothetical protein Pjdr2_3064 [Paenibacillus sp. JDR-2]